MATRSHIFSACSVFFAFVPVPSPKARCLTVRYPDSVGTALPAQAAPEITHSMCGGLPSSPTLERNSGPSVGVLRPHTRQHVPRERGFVGHSKEMGIEPEQGLLSWNSSACSELPYAKVSLQNPPVSTSRDISEGRGKQGLCLCA